MSINPWGIPSNTNTFTSMNINPIEPPRDSFVIIFQKSKYFCNKIAVNSSEVIREYRKNNPDSNEYEYIYDGPFDGFPKICDFFNLEHINLSISDINSVRIHAENLKIDAILTKISQYSDTYEQIVQKTNPIDDIFSWLYQIKQRTVEKVTNLIINSPWSHTEAKIKELTAFILQVVRSGYILHPYLAELIVSLDESSSKSNDIDLLKPFLSKQILNFFYKNKFYCHFVHTLVQKSVIQMDEVVEKIIKTDSFLHYNNRFITGSIRTNNNNGSNNANIFYSSGDSNYYPNSSNDNIDLKNRKKLNIEFERSDHENIVIWFFAEIIQLKNINKSDLFDGLNSSTVEYLRPYLKGNIEEYKRKRDLCECDNEIIRAISDDDVDTLQSIISKNNIDINTISFKFSVFKKFSINSSKGLLNISAEFGAVKCFKYLLLNHAQINDLTLGHAIYGGNTEIIRIIDQQKTTTTNVSLSCWSHKNPYIGNKENKDANNNNDINNNNNNNNNPWGTNNNNAWGSAWGPQPIQINRPIQNNLSTRNPNKYFKFEFDNFISPIDLAIMTHQYNLFDWIIDEKISSNELTSVRLSDLVETSIISGNIHTFIFCCENGFALSQNMSKLYNLIKIASEFGYYGFVELIMSLYKGVSSIKFESNLSPFYFGNIEIRKLLLKNNQYSHQSLLFAIQNDYDDIFQYILDNNNNNSNQNQQKKNVLEIYEYVLEKGSFPIFKIAESKFSLDDLLKKYKFTLNDFTSLCIYCCSGGNIDIAHEFIEFCIKNVPNLNITRIFLASCQYQHEDICKYLLEKKNLINFSEILDNYMQIFALDSITILELIENFDPDLKESISRVFFNESIQTGNKEIFKIMLPNHLTNKKILISAVSFNDMELVNQVLNSNSSPSFVNQVSKKGTALHIAVENGNIAIIKRLLEISGIDPNLKNEQRKTPLIIAAQKLNIEAFNLILDFYGDNIKSQYWQLCESATTIKKNYFQNNNAIINLILQNIIAFITRLLQVYRYSFENTDFFASACNNKSIEIVKELLKIEDINVNEQDSSTGNTPLISALLNKNNSLANILIQCPRTDINISNYNGSTALSIAASNGMNDIMSNIINNPKFDSELNNINYAFFISHNPSVLKILYQVKELDVNFQISKLDSFQRNNFDLMETTLTEAVKQNDIQKIDMIIQHPSFNASKSNIKKVFDINIPDIIVFQKLFNLLDDPNVICSSGNSLFQNLFNSNNFNYLTIFMKNEKVKLQKKELVSSFEKLITNGSNMSLSIMKLFAEYDENHDHFIEFDKLTESGRSFFTKINNGTKNIAETVTFFLEHKVNPNMPDNFEIYPLQHAIKMNSIGFVKALVDSKKIDYKVTLKETINYEEKTFSYFQLATRFSNDGIVKLLLKENIGNIESKEENNSNDENEESQLANLLDDLISFNS